jgi:uncharacterized protein YjbI with pentapeptide repeats
MPDLSREDVIRMTYTGNKTLKGLDLSGVDLSNLDLSGCDFTGCKLVRTSFKGANLTGANMSKVVAASAQFSGANLNRTIFGLAHLSGATFHGAKTGETKMIAVDLHNVRMDKEVATGVNDWTGCWFPGAKAAGVTVPSKPMMRPKEASKLDEDISRQIHSAPAGGQQRFRSITRTSF